MDKHFAFFLLTCLPVYLSIGLKREIYKHFIALLVDGSWSKKKSERASKQSWKRLYVFVHTI